LFHSVVHLILALICYLSNLSMFFCSFVAAAGVLFPVKWMFFFRQIAPFKLSADLLAGNI